MISISSIIKTEDTSKRRNSQIAKIPQQWELCNLEMIFSFYLRVGNQRWDLIFNNNSISWCQLLLNLTFVRFTTFTSDSCNAQAQTTSKNNFIK